MPIKFRCPHCQQFLGISRSKAGAVTDCPACGRGIRVPDLDGTVAPLPSPELNLADRGLASALDKLANLIPASVPVAAAPAIGIESRELGGPAFGESARPSEPSEPRPLPMPEPIAVLPAPAPRVIEVAAPEPISPVHPPPRELQQAATADALQSLAAIALESRARESRSGWSPRATLALASLVLAAGLFGAGYLVGRGSTPATTSPATSDTNAAEPEAQPIAPVGQPAPATEPAITGRISFISTDGQSLPDAGARVLVLPEERQGTSKLPVEGFRPGAAAEDLQLAIAAARAVGGDFAIVDAGGNYSIFLPRAGVFQVLTLSRYQQRDGTATQSDWLANYFERPAQVVGQAAEQSSVFPYRGSGSSPRDHTFERP
jgi:hypothetical protein